MKTVTDSLNEQINDLGYLSEQIEIGADDIDRQDMSETDWLKLRSTLQWSFSESMSFYPVKETGREYDEKTPVIHEFDSRDDSGFLSHCAYLQELSTTFRKWIADTTDPANMEQQDWESLRQFIEDFRKNISDTLSSLFTEGTPTDFEVGTLIIHRSENGFAVGVRPRKKRVAGLPSAGCPHCFPNDVEERLRMAMDDARHRLLGNN